MKEEIWNNIIKRLTDTETPLSKSELNHWLAENKQNTDTYNEVVLLWQMSSNIKTMDPPAVFDPIQGVSEKQKPLQKFKAIYRYGIAAAFIATLGFASFSLYQNNQKNEPQQWITRSSEPGKLLSITLPDGSTVMLNAGSSISYAKNILTNKTRKVKLTGEAFFDVVNKEKQPFIVESSAIKTIVYGTSFNVRAYNNESNIKVSVKTGKVGVLVNDPTNQVKPTFLLPNTKLNFNTITHKFSNIIKDNNEDNEWINGTLVFEQTPLNEVVQTLSRRFAVKFDISACKHQSSKLSARFQNKDLNTILKMIQKLTNIEINQTRQTIYLKGGNPCNEN